MIIVGRSQAVTLTILGRDFRPMFEQSVVKVEGAALRAPRGQMQGGEPQAMSMHIVEASQRSRWPRAAATRRELSRAIIAVFTCRRETRRFIAHAQPHGSCWALPSSVWRSLQRPRMRAIAALLLLDDPRRDRLRRRALRSHHNTHARDPFYFHHGLLRADGEIRGQIKCGARRQARLDGRGRLDVDGPRPHGLAPDQVRPPPGLCRRFWRRRADGICACTASSCRRTIVACRVWVSQRSSSSSS